MLVREVFERYLSHSSANQVHGQEALAQRRFLFDLFCQTFGDRDVAELLPHHLQDWIDQNAQRWKSSSTRKAKANQINAALNWAANGRRITENPCRSVRYAEAERRPCLADKDFHKIVLQADKHFERLLWLVRLLGCRRETGCVIAWTEIQWERKCIVTCNHKTYKKTRKPLVMALVAEALELLRKIRAEECVRRGCEPEELVGPICLNTKFKPYDPQHVTRQFRRCKERAKVKAAGTLHGMRHQWATSAVLGGAELLAVAKQLGHASTAITERYYTHVDDDVDFRMNAAEAAKPK